ncbi:MAG TPA: hypothetical protein VEJ00_03040 [Candidatus Acidoferrales bacterium]|nr:hypothetical protein [Candidatus Acidoferrales bacterium]
MDKQMVQLDGDVRGYRVSTTAPAVARPALDLFYFMNSFGVLTQQWRAGLIAVGPPSL